MTKLGLKCDTSQQALNNRLTKEGVAVLELYLTPNDLIGAGLTNLIAAIKQIQAQGVKAVLHHPTWVNNRYNEYLDTTLKESDFFLFSTKLLVELCEEFDTKMVQHITYSPDTLANGKFHKGSKDEMLAVWSNVLELNQKYAKGRILWENSIEGPNGFFRDFGLVELLKGTSIPLCFDVSHAYISLERDNASLLETLIQLENNIQYYHVVDSLGYEHDGLTLGQGNVDFKQLKPYIIKRDYIYEVLLKDTKDCTEMVKSHQYFSQL